MIIETALDAVVTMDATGAITGWSTQAEIMFDVPRTEAVGKSLTNYLSASFRSTPPNARRLTRDWFLEPFSIDALRCWDANARGITFPSKLP